MNEYDKKIRRIVDVTIRRLATWFLLLFLCSMFINLTADRFQIGFDDTDGAERSGMFLHVDYGTGCQYLGSPRGGLTPRLDGDGQQVCK